MLWWLFIRKNVLILSNPRFFMPRWCTENHTEIAAILAHDRVFKGQGSGDYSDVTSRTRQSVFRAFSYSLLVYVWKVRSILVANRRNIPHRYIVGGCSIVRSSESVIALHTIPFYGDERLEAKKRRKRRIHFVRQRRAGWDPSKSSVICSKHFKADDFVRNYALITDKLAQLIRSLFSARQFRVYRLPDCSSGGTRRLERSRQKNDKTLRLRQFELLVGLQFFLVSF